MILHLPRLLALLALLLAAPCAIAQPADAAALRAETEKRDKIDKLIAQLAGADADTRGRIEKELTEIGRDVMVPLKLAALSDNFELRKAAIATSARLRWRLAAGPELLAKHSKLIDVMAGSDAAARAALVDEIVTGDPNATPVRRYPPNDGGPASGSLAFFGECLADDQTYVRQRAIDGLLAAVENGTPKQHVAPYLEAAIADPDRNIRVLAIGALAEVGGASLSKLTAMLNDESMEVRATIIQAIGRSRDQAAADHLKPLLKDPQWRIRAAALDAMGQLRLERNAGRVADAVIECLADEDPFVRGKAAKLLADWKHASAGATLRKMLADKRIDEDTAFASLATLNDTEAVPLMLKAYETAEPVRRAQLLRWLSYYRNETRTGALLAAAIRDESMKAAWPQIIGMMAWQPDAAKHRPRFIELLLTGDAETTEAAWEALQRTLRQQPFEPEVVEALFKSPGSQRGVIALHAAYITGGEAIEKSLPRGLAHADAKVIDLALVLTAQHYLKHPLGGELPYKPYMGDEMDEEMLMRFNPGARPAKPKPAQPVMSDAIRDAVAAHLAHQEFETRTRAAGILYRDGKAKAEPAAAVLRTSLKDPDSDNRRLALIAIAAKPGPFMSELDLPALAADEITAGIAIEIMAASGDAKYLDTIKKFAQNVSAEEPETILALIRSGQPEIVKLAAARVKTLQEYEQQEFQRHLRGMEGPGAVLFMEQFLNPNARNSYMIVQTATIILTLPDPSVKDLLVKISKMKIEDYGESIMPRITARLLDLDPEGTLGQLRDDLTKGNARKQATALAALLSAAASKQAIDLAWEGARTKAKDASPAWAGIATWLPEEEVSGRWIRELATLHAPLQGALLRRLATDLKPGHLATLTTIGTSDPATREYLSSLIAILTANDSAARPALDKVAEAALPQVLSAAAEWGEAVKAVDPYLMDPRAAVADGARRGLALHLIAKPRAVELSDAHREALLAGAMSKDDVTAFLCAEALAMHAPKSLAAIELEKLASDYPKLRLALMQGDEAAPALREVVKKHIPDGGEVSSMLAFRAARKGDIPLGSLGRGRDVYGDKHAALLALAAATSDVDLARKLLDIGLAPGVPGSPEAKVIDLLLAEARKGDARLFARLIQYIEEPAEGDLARLLASAAHFDAAQHEQLLSAALYWSPESPSEEITKQIGSNNEAAILASAIAVIRWGDAKTRESLLSAATRKKAALFGAALGKRRNLAVLALRIAGKAEDVPALLAGYQNIDAKDRDEQLARMAYQRLVLRLAPQEAIKLLPALSDEDRRFGMYNERALMGVKFESSLMLLDDAKWKAPEIAEEERYNTTQAMTLLNLLAEQKAAIAAKQPAAVEVLPPWNGGDYSPGGANKRMLYGDAAAQAKKQLEMRIAMLRDVERMEEAAAARPAGNTPGARRGPSRFDGPSSLDLFDDEEMDDSDRMRLRMMMGSFDGSGYGSDTESRYGSHLSSERWSGVAELGEEAVVAALKPFMESKWPGARIAAMAAAAGWWTPSLGDAIAARLREGVSENERVEAAWALATLRGPEAAKAIDEARLKRDALADFSERLRLACLLRLLGSEAGRAEIDRALELRAMRSLRVRFTTPPRVMNMNQFRPRRAVEAFDGFDEEIHFPGDGMGQYDGRDPLSDRLEPWRTALQVGAADLLRGLDAHVSVRPDDAYSYAARRERSYKRIAPPVVAMFADARMVAIGANPVPPPVDSLVTSAPAIPAHMMQYYNDQSSGRFLLMLEAEQSLEPLFFVQFADGAKDAAELRQQWLAWWKENKDKPREQWMRQALTQATAELTHTNWWHRLRAARRIMRLTGAKITPPNPFDLPAWKAMQSQWAAKATDEVTVMLLKHALEAKTIKSLPDAADRAALLKSLVHIAGHGPAHLSEAALVHLHAWPDEDALLRAALAWQHAPRRELMEWLHGRMEARGVSRAVYVEADLK